MKKAKHIWLIFSLVTLIFCLCSCTNNTRNNQSDETTTEAAPTEDISHYNDDTPDFEYTDKALSEFKSRDDVYDEYLRVYKEYERFCNEYDENWSEQKTSLNETELDVHLFYLREVLTYEFPEKSKSDISAEKDELIQKKLVELSCGVQFYKDAANACKDEEKKSIYLKKAAESEAASNKADEFVKEYRAGKHTENEVLDYLRITYDENINPAFIPQKYNPNAG